MGDEMLRSCTIFLINRPSAPRKEAAYLASVFAPRTFFGRRPKKINKKSVVFCRVRTNHARVFTPGITLQRTSVSSVGHSYPYPELLGVLYDIHTRTRKFWKFCTTFIPVPGTSGNYVRPWPQYPGYGYSMFCNRSELL